MMTPTILIVIYVLLGIFLVVAIVISIFILMIVARFWKMFKGVFDAFSDFSDMRRIFKKRFIDWDKDY